MGRIIGTGFTSTFCLLLQNDPILVLACKISRMVKALVLELLKRLSLHGSFTSNHHVQVTNLSSLVAHLIWKLTCLLIYHVASSTVRICIL